MNVKNIVFLLVVSGLLIGTAYAANGARDFSVDKSYNSAFGGDYSALYLNQNQDSGIAIYQNVDDDLYDDMVGDEYDHLIHDDGQHYLSNDDDYTLTKKIDNPANFTDRDDAEHGVVELVDSHGQQYIVVFWAKDTSSIDNSDLTSLLKDFNKDNNVTPVAF